MLFVICIFRHSNLRKNRQIWRKISIKLGSAKPAFSKSRLRPGLGEIRRVLHLSPIANEGLYIEEYTCTTTRLRYCNLPMKAWRAFG